MKGSFSSYGIPGLEPERRAMLSQSFFDNPYEFAGLADLPEDDEFLKQTFIDLRNWLGCRTLLSTEEELAEVMFALIRVAQSDYEDGSYWPCVKERLGLVSLVPQDQERLGDWFRRGLNRFNYFVPKPKKSQKHLTPILIHAGVPRGSLEGLIQFVTSQLERHGNWLADPAESAPDLIRQLVRGYTGPLLHRNVRRILRSKRRGAAELWSSLARVILAPADSPESEEALRLLPPGVNPKTVREAVRRNATSTTYRQTSRPPQLRYDPDTGSVRLRVHRGSAEDWDLQAGECRYNWDSLPDGASAEFFDPLPEDISIRPLNSEHGIRREFSPRPAEWPGLWFRASTGNLEQGTAIDGSGVEPGRWFVLFEGTPDQPGDAVPKPLNWAFFGSENWSAWEVDVPARSKTQQRFVWKVGENEFSVPLARRPGPSVRISDPILYASSQEGDRLAVYGECPVVTLDRDRPYGAQLWRRMGDRWEPGRKLELCPDQQMLLTLELAGLYRLRETQGMGRILAEFAFVPGLKVKGPTIRSELAHVEVEADAQAGTIRSTADCGGTKVHCLRPGVWHASISTVEPQLTTVWNWRDQETPDLLFRWVIPGFRWTIMGLKGEIPKWTRELIVVDEARVTHEAAQLEIHIPEGSDLRINGEIAILKPGIAGLRAMRSLNAYSGLIRLTHHDTDHDAVLTTRRPILERFEVEFDETAVIASWQPTPPGGTVLLAWDPLSLTESPKVVQLTEAELREPGEWVGTWEALPQSDNIAVALARRHSSSGLSLGPSTYVPAIDRLDRRKAKVWLCERPNGRSGEITRLWSRLAFDIQVDLLSPKPRAEIDIAARLKEIQQGGPLPLRQILAFASALATSPLLRVADKEWVRRYAEEIRQRANSPTMLESWVECAYSVTEKDDATGVGQLLRNGIHPGWAQPECLPYRPSLLDSLTLPLKYYRDLSLISTASSQVTCITSDFDLSTVHGPTRDDRLRAAKRVRNFHQIWELPSPELFLPWRSGAVTVPDREPHRYHELNFKRPAGEGEDHFLEELGLNFLEIDGTDPKRGGKFELTWDPGENGWTIEARWNNRFTRPWSTGTTPLLCPYTDPLRLAERIGLRDLLVHWAPKTTSLKETQQLLPTDPIDEFLKREPASAALHSFVLEPPQVAERLLQGVSIRIATDRPIHDTVHTAWRISWVDRLAARRGTDKLFGPGGLRSIEKSQYLGALAVMLEREEGLMVRTLALVELLIRTLYDGGIGFAGKFAIKPR